MSRDACGDAGIFEVVAWLQWKNLYLFNSRIAHASSESFTSTRLTPKRHRSKAFGIEWCLRHMKQQSMDNLWRKSFFDVYFRIVIVALAALEPASQSKAANQIYNHERHFIDCLNFQRKFIATCWIAWCVSDVIKRSRRNFSHISRRKTFSVLSTS